MRKCPIFLQFISNFLSNSHFFNTFSIMYYWQFLTISHFSPFSPISAPISPRFPSFPPIFSWEANSAAANAEACLYNGWVGGWVGGLGGHGATPRVVEHWLARGATVQGPVKKQQPDGMSHRGSFQAPEAGQGVLGCRDKPVQRCSAKPL